MARRREIDAILVWKLDRFGRSLVDLVTTLNELRSLDVVFVSLTESLDFSTPSGRAMAGRLSTFAEFERDIIRERVKAGIAKPKSEYSSKYFLIVLCEEANSSAIFLIVIPESRIFWTISFVIKVFGWRGNGWYPIA